MGPAIGSLVPVGTAIRTSALELLVLVLTLVFALLRWSGRLVLCTCFAGAFRSVVSSTATLRTHDVFLVLRRPLRLPLLPAAFLELALLLAFSLHGANVHRGRGAGVRRRWLRAACTFACNVGCRGDVPRSPC